MELKTPRIAPLPETQWDEETRELMEQARRGDRILNIFRTLAHHPKLLKRWRVFGGHLLYNSSLPARERELLILRIAWLQRGEYEWGQHSQIGKDAGLTDVEIPHRYSPQQRRHRRRRSRTDAIDRSGVGQGDGRKSQKQNAKYGIRVNAIMPGLIHTPMAIKGPSRARQINEDQLTRERDA